MKDIDFHGRIPNSGENQLIARENHTDHKEINDRVSF